MYSYGPRIWQELIPYAFSVPCTQKPIFEMAGWHVRRYCIRMLLPLICTQDKVREGRLMHGECGSRVPHPHHPLSPIEVLRGNIDVLGVHRGEMFRTWVRDFLRSLSSAAIATCLQIEFHHLLD